MDVDSEEGKVITKENEHFKNICIATQILEGWSDCLTSWSFNCFFYSGFQLSNDSKLHYFALVLHCFTLWLAGKTCATFPTNEHQNQYQSQLAHTHFPVLYASYMYVIASYSDTLIALFPNIIRYCRYSIDE